MTIAIISFYISYTAIIGMIVYKSTELNSGRKMFLSRWADKTNHKIHTVYNEIRRYISYINKRSALALVQWIAYHILSWARELYIWLHKKAHAHPPSKKVIDMVRGKGDIKRNRGGASLYLKRIGEFGEEEVK